GAHHRILADQVIEGRRAVLAREHAVGGSARRPIARHQAGLGLLFALAHNAIRSASPDAKSSRDVKSSRVAWRERWEADERPEPRSLGLLPSGPDPVGEWLVHRQPPASISAQRKENASRGRARSTPGSSLGAVRRRPPPWETAPWPRRLRRL